MKKYFSVIPSVLLFCFVVGCQDKAAMAELEQFKAQAAVEEANQALVMKAANAWANGEIETLREDFSSDYILHSSGKDVSLEETLEFIKNDKALWSDEKFDFHDTFAKGDKVVMRNSYQGTHVATGKRAEERGIAIFRCENGKIVEMWVAEDSLGLYQQLGYELKPPEEKK